MKSLLGLGCCVCILSAFLIAAIAEEVQHSAPGQAKAPTPTIEAFKNNKVEFLGFFNAYWDGPTGQLYLEVPEQSEDFIYVGTLASGIGTTDLTYDLDTFSGALDRGMTGPTHLVAFRRFGPRMLLIERNTNYMDPRAALGSVGDAGLSFANAVVWGFDISAEEQGRVIIDITPLFKRDGIGLAAALRKAKQGKYSYNSERSAIDANTMHNSDRSTDIEVLSTFINDEPPTDDAQKRLLYGVVADRSTITVRQRYSFVKLPVDGYTPRAYDPRCGLFAQIYRNPSAAGTEPLECRYLERFRLVKKDPEASISEPVQPIVFYVDSSVPKEYRSAVIEGASWWDAAFEAAGFKNAFRVEPLPQGIDPLAVGVNIITWVPRSSRGWSYGMSIVDPRTGEILKSTVRLDGMRLRFDRRLLEGLTEPYAKDGCGSASIDAVLLQRLRNLAAHEVGHGLGLRHQHIESAQSDSSVMGYPSPKISLTPLGKPVLMTPYGTGVGDWDKVAIQYGYRQFGEAEKESPSLERLLAEARERGYYWMTDEDTDDAEPLVQTWVQGSDPVASLEQVMKVREAALERFSVDAIPNSAPLVELQDTFVPIYLLHRFEVKAVAAMLGGIHYEHVMRDAQPPQPVPADQQRRALQALLATLAPETLTPSERLLALMSPRPPGYDATSESFSGDTGEAFDATNPAVEAARLTLDEILRRERAARLIEYHARDSQMPSFDEVLRAVLRATWQDRQRTGLQGAVQRAVGRVVLESLFNTAADTGAPPQIRAACWLCIVDLRLWLQAQASPSTPEWRAHFALALWDIDRIERDPSQFKARPRASPRSQPMGDR